MSRVHFRATFIFVITKFNVRLFADDTNLTMRSNSLDELQNNVNLELTNVINWMRNNRLSINFAKTE